ncbi:MAG: 50S ribosomal protein L17 [Alphaproteobacteria bacterium 40-19]|nr:MAG: 50S ribosomal protein L17 [Alphaproteobacteria bacterium 40-19]
MRHNMAHRKFGRTTNQRKALLLGLTKSLIEKEQIVTTLPKAKDLRPIVEKLITFGKLNDSLHGRRYLLSVLRSSEACNKVLTVLSKRYNERPGGYLRIVKAGFRQGDNAPMAVVQFV